MNLLTALRYLVSLDEHRHFGRAAQACHITQPALSNAIRSLETEFGVVIVRRARVYGGLTPEGELVLRSAHRLLREHESMMQSLRGSAASPHGRLRMAAVPTAIPLLSRFAALLRMRHPGIVPVVLSLSSQELEKRLEDLSLDLALGYVERMADCDVKLDAWPQSQERYFLLQREEGGGEGKAGGAGERDGANEEAGAGGDDGRPPLRFGAPIAWAEAGAQPLCLLTPDMYNRALVDRMLRDAGRPSEPAIETNSVLTLALAVQAGDVASVLPAAMLATVRDARGLLARPLIEPDLRTPIGFMTQAGVRPSHALSAALALIDDPVWRDQRDRFSGALGTG